MRLRSYLSPNVAHTSHAPDRRDIAFHVPGTGATLLKAPISLEDLLDDLADETLEKVVELADLVRLVDQLLAQRGLRLASEDELEIALGGDLFAWGSGVPDGEPQRDRTEFTDHVGPSGVHRLELNGDTYRCELVRTALKLGDGGVALCGAYPWPMAWLALSSSWRVPVAMLEDLFVWTEGATARVALLE